MASKSYEWSWDTNLSPFRPKGRRKNKRSLRCNYDHIAAYNFNGKPFRPNGRRCNKRISRCHPSVSSFLVKSLAESSISGINRIASAGNCCQMFFWILVLAFCLCGFGYQTFGFLKQFYRKLSVVQTQVENDGLAEFPAVTLCNSNRFRKSEFCNYMPQKCFGKYQNITLSEQEIENIVYNLLSERNPVKKYQLGHTKDMVSDCRFNGYPKVNSDECRQMLEYFYDPDYGNCYTIPSKNLKGQTLKASEVNLWQETTDLTLIVDLEVEEFLERRRSSHIILTVHDDSLAPDMHSHGVSLEAGYFYTVTIKKTSQFLLPSPFKTNCTDYSSLPWRKHTKRDVTSRICTVGCSQFYQQAECSFITKYLSLFYEVLPYDPKRSTEGDKICAENVEKMTRDYCRNVCGLPCRYIIFDLNVRRSEFSRSKMLPTSILLNMTWEEKIKNLAVVKIQYATLEHKIFRHLPKYESMELFSYLGGYSGMWLGFSLLTVYELIEILLSTAKFALQKHQRAFKKMFWVTTKTKKRRNFKKKRKHCK